ncbi:MAG: hypothetical protein J6O13_10975 [Selenomonas sp.]|nr:hypothetical protein [Selenomonas sp.]
MEEIMFTKNIQEPTSENILCSIEENPLERNGYLKNFIQGLSNAEGGVCIALDGHWGSGKTFFVKQAQSVIEQKAETALEYAEKYRLDKEQLKKLIPIYYDAWRNDDCNDPLLSIVYTILNEITCCVDNPWEKPEYKKMLPILADCITKLPVSKILDKIKDGDAVLKYFKDRDKLQGKIQILFNDIIESQRKAKNLDDDASMKIVLFIDELDRCSPEFAIRLLERIKHYIDNPDIIFVLSVNLDELQHTIMKFYGSEFSATSYLDRFFDFRLTLKAVENRLQKELIDYTDDNDLRYRVVNAVIDEFSFTLRERYRYISWCQWTQGNYDRDYHAGADFCNQIMVPYMIALKMRDLHEYDQFINGNRCEEYVQFIIKTVKISSVMRYFAPFDRAFGMQMDEANKNELINKLTCLYNYVWKKDVSPFDADHISQEGAIIGRLCVEVDTAKSLLDIVGLLG